MGLDNYIKCTEKKIQNPTGTLTLIKTKPNVILIKTISTYYKQFKKDLDLVGLNSFSVFKRLKDTQTDRQADRIR